MSAADRMAVRMPGGEIRSVPRRVGLAMVARSQAKHAPQQSAPRPGAKGQRPAPASRYTPEMFEGTARADVDVDVSDQIDLTQITVLPDSDQIDLTPDHDVTAQTSGVVDLADHDAVVEPVEFEEDVERPRGNAARKVWAEFARVHGVEVTGYMTRDQIRDAVDAKIESDRMSRPAHEGGRPATPEDEPVTEGAVTHADPGERTA